MNRFQLTLTSTIAFALAGCALTSSTPTAPTDQEIEAAMKDSFRERSIAKLDRVLQSPLQKACTQYALAELPKPLRDSLEKAALDAVKHPADGKYLGDWQRGERIAQSGVGMQFTDNAQTVAGGNCYACHQLDKKELAYGNIGPPLHNYGKLRGQSEPILKYTWAKIYNAHAFNACSSMPRFGDAGILTEAQMKDVMALLLDPKSSVNQ